MHLPLPDERIYAPYKIHALADVLAEQGISPEDSLSGTGLAIDDLENPFALTSVRQYMTVCMNALSLSCNSATPFEVGARLRVSAYGTYGYALLSCLSLRDYFKLAVKYRRLATPPMAIEWGERDGQAVWGFPNIFVLNPSEGLRRFLLEQQFSLHVRHLQDVAGTKYPPLRANFSYTEPEHVDLYTSYLNCPCFFNQARCELIYEGAVLDQRPMMAHPLTSILVQQTCDRLLGQEKTTIGTSGSVYRILMDRPGVFPGMEIVADILNMTSRTLRRRLKTEGTSYQKIMDDVRSTLAHEYLRTTNMNILDIAMLLGFNDAAGFRKAMRRWSGCSPEQFRK